MILTPDGTRLVLYCSEARGGRATLNIRAPVEYKIKRPCRDAALAGGEARAAAPEAVNKTSER